MLNLFLYSDPSIPENQQIDGQLAHALGSNARVAYVASSPDPELTYFKSKKDYYSAFGVRLEHYFDPADSSNDLDDLLTYDAIHLSGGDTFGFLRQLQDRKMLNTLRDWAVSGGLMIGVSAGAMIMTPNIALEALFNDAAPQNESKFDGMGLLPFEFFPHSQSKPHYLSDLQRYSQLNGRPIVACPDGQGIIVRNGALEFVGDLLWIENGEIQPASTKHFAESWAAE